MCWANFFALTPTIRPSRAKNVAHEARQHGDIETRITSAPENCTKNTHFSPAKAMAVSDNRATWPTEPGRGTRGPEAMSSPVISHLDPLTRTSARRHARGPYNPHVNPIICAWAAPPTCMSRGLRAHQRVNVHVQGLTCERRTMPGTVVPKTQTTSHTTPRFHRFLPRWSALWVPHHLTSGPHRHQTGGFALHGGPTRRRHAP